MSTIKNLNEIKIHWPANMLIIGPTKSGKSNILQNLIKKYKDDFYMIVKFGHDSCLVKDHKKFITNTTINIDLLKNILKKKDDKNVLIIFDDVMGQFLKTDNTFWEDFSSRCRHKNISVIYSIQYLKTITPAMRSNVLYILMTDINNNDYNELKKITSCDSKEMNELRKKVINYHPLFICLAVEHKGVEVITVDLI